MKFRIDTKYNKLGESIYTLHQKLSNGKWFYNPKHSFKNRKDALLKAQELKCMEDQEFKRIVTGREFSL